METIYQDIAARTGGSIYIGVVGPVRTGKSTLIRRIMEHLVIPNIPDPGRADRARDELPQSGSGRTIMTAEPKFVPEQPVQICPDGSTALQIRLIDSVGYMVPGAVGASEDGVPRMVSTPWSDAPIPMTEAAELGTRKVLEDHASIGIVVTTDGTITDIPRSDYVQSEGRAIRDIQATGKPFLTIINTAAPGGEAAAALRTELKQNYGVDAAIADCQNLGSEGICALLQDLLFAFPLVQARIRLPRWVDALEDDTPWKQELFHSLLERTGSVKTLGHAEQALNALEELPQVEAVGGIAIDPATGTVRCSLTLPEGLYYDALSECTGTAVRSESELMTLLKELTAVKQDYDRISEALEQVRSTGYGVVLPDSGELQLQKPELLRRGGACGIRIRAGAPSIHMIRVDLDTEITPMVGDEKQSKELLTSLTEAAPEELCRSNLFGRSVGDLIGEGLRSKLTHTSPEVRRKFRGSLTKIVNDGANGLICIIL